MARKKKNSLPEPPPERPTITHWRDWLATPEPEVEEEVQADEDTLAADSEDTDTTKRKRRPMLVTGLAAGVLAVVGLGGAFAVIQTNNGESTAPSPAAMEESTTSSTSSSAAPPPPEFCTRWGETAEDGTTETAQGAIKRLQYAYYVDRDAEGALAAYSDDALVSGEALRTAIEQTPEETEHCLYIEPVEPEAGLYLVDLHVQNPDESVITYKQSVTVQQEGEGEYAIVAVKERKDGQ